MSELQLWLAAAGVALVILVVGLNRLAEWRAGRRAEEAFRAAAQDPLLDAAAARLEPTMGAPEAPAAEAPAPVAPVAEPPVVAPTLPAEATPALAPSVLSPVVDTVALVVANDPLTRDALAPLESALERLQRPVHLEGLEGDRWVPLAASARDAWREIRAGLQLATRAGPASEEAVAAFNEAVSAFATQSGAVSQRESPAEAAERARNLDALCAETDVELVINVRGRNGATFSVQRVRALAGEAGLEPAGPGRFARFGPDGAPTFGLRFADVPPPRDGGYATGLTFAFDVPHVADPMASLDALALAANRFAAELAGEVVDDSGRPLTAAGLAVIRRTLEPVVAQLAERGIPAGSPLARRLFS